MREEVGGGECMGREAEKVGVALWAGSVRIPERLGIPTLLETGRGDGELSQGVCDPAGLCCLPAGLDGT